MTIDRRMWNRIAAISPVILSLGALILAVTVIATGWERGLKDEGAAAHLFQLLIAAEAPLIAAFLATADWRRPAVVARAAACQAAALGLALAPVALFQL